MDGDIDKNSESIRARRSERLLCVYVRVCACVYECVYVCVSVRVCVRESETLNRTE